MTERQHCGVVVCFVGVFAVVLLKTPCMHLEKTAQLICPSSVHPVSLLKNLKHANIVTLHDIIHTDRCLTLVFEYLVSTFNMQHAGVPKVLTSITRAEYWEICVNTVSVVSYRTATLNSTWTTVGISWVCITSRWATLSATLDVRNTTQDMFPVYNRGCTGRG